MNDLKMASGTIKVFAILCLTHAVVLIVSSAEITSKTGGLAKRQFTPCQDNSGGICVDLSTCPDDAKPAIPGEGACGDGFECCFSPPENDKTCASHGGECVPSADQCFSTIPPYEEAEDCEGQICCILANA